MCVAASVGLCGGLVVVVGLWWLWVCGGCRSPAWDAVVGCGLLLAVICGGCRFVVAGAWWLWVAGVGCGGWVWVVVDSDCDW